MSELNKLAVAKSAGATLGLVALIAAFVVAQVFIAAEFWIGALVVLITICLLGMLFAIGRGFYGVFDPHTREAKAIAEEEKAKARHKSEIANYRYCDGDCGWKECGKA